MRVLIYGGYFSSFQQDILVSVILWQRNDKYNGPYLLPTMCEYNSKTFELLFLLAELVSTSPSILKLSENFSLGCLVVHLTTIFNLHCQYALLRPPPIWQTTYRLVTLYREWIYGAEEGRNQRKFLFFVRQEQTVRLHM